MRGIGTDWFSLYIEQLCWAPLKNNSWYSYQSLVHSFFNFCGSSCFFVSFSPPPFLSAYSKSITNQIYFADWLALVLAVLAWSSGTDGSPRFYLIKTENGQTHLVNASHASRWGNNCICISCIPSFNPNQRGMPSDSKGGAAMPRFFWYCSLLYRNSPKRGALDLEIQLPESENFLELWNQHEGCTGCGGGSHMLKPYKSF